MCATAFLTLEEGLDSYNNCIARKAGESASDKDASSLLLFVVLMAFIKAWK